MSLPSDNPVLDVRGLRCRAERRALTGVDLAVGAGETVAVLGPAGSGKSILVDCLIGDRELTGGAVWMNGTAMSGLPRRRWRELCATRCGLVHQRAAFMPELTIAENVALPLLFAGVGGGPASARASVWLERFEIAELAEATATRLSHDVAARMALARGMVNDPLILFADEPFEGLDDAESAALARIVHAVAVSHGVAVVLLTRHAQTAAMCDRVVHLEDGRTRSEPVPRPQPEPVAVDRSFRRRAASRATAR